MMDQSYVIKLRRLKLKKNNSEKRLKTMENKK